MTLGHYLDWAISDFISTGLFVSSPKCFLAFYYFKYNFKIEIVDHLYFVELQNVLTSKTDPETTERFY